MLKPRASYRQTIGMTRVQGFLSFCGAVNGLGFLARLPHLSWPHPYFSTMGTTLLLAMVALRVCRRSELAALNLFCWLALPVTMLAASNEKHIHPELTWSAQMALPLLGLLAVAFLGRDSPSTLGYFLGAAGATAWMIWALYGRQGGAGVAVFGLAVMGALLVGWINSGPVQLARDVDEQKGRVKKITQELKDDRRTIQQAYGTSRQTRGSPEPD